MRALTLTQPWATLVAEGAKGVETRSWATAYRGPLAIHAAKALRPESSAAWEHNPHIRHVLREAGIRELGELPRGVVLAVVQLVDVVPADLADVGDRERAFGDFSSGRYAWRLEQVRALDVPVPARGALSLWEWTEEEAVPAEEVGQLSLLGMP